MKPVFPYVCTAVLNMDTLVPLFTIQTTLGADRPARLLRPENFDAHVFLAVETVAESQGRPMPGAVQLGRVGSPWLGLSPTAFLDQNVPFQMLVDDPWLGTMVLGSAPATVVGTTPVPIQWDRAPAVFPPAIPPSSPAWRLRPACGNVTRARNVFTGVPFAVVDNTVSANELRALPVEDVAGGATLFRLAWVPPSSDLGNTVHMILAWPGNTSPPLARQLFCPVVPKPCRRPRPREPPLTDPEPLGGCADGGKPIVRPLVPLSDPLRLPVTLGAPPPRPRRCYRP